MLVAQNSLGPVSRAHENMIKYALAKGRVFGATKRLLQRRRGRAERDAIFFAGIFLEKIKTGFSGCRSRICSHPCRNTQSICTASAAARIAQLSLPLETTNQPLPLRAKLASSRALLRCMWHAARRLASSAAMRPLKVGFVGAGAVGTYFGVRLAELGHDVRFLVRKRHDAPERLCVKSWQGDFALEGPTIARSGGARRRLGPGARAV